MTKQVVAMRYAGSVLSRDFLRGFRGCYPLGGFLSSRDLFHKTQFLSGLPGLSP